MRRWRDALDLQIEGRRGGAVRHGIDAVGAGYAPGSLPDIPVVSDEGSYYRRDLDHNNPIAIGVGEDSFWPSLAVAHEIGHFVDHAGLPGTGYQSVVRTMPEDSSHREGARRCLRRVLDASAGAVGAGSCPVHSMAFGEQADA